MIQIPILAANNIGILIPILFLPILPIQIRYFFRYFCKSLLLGLGKHLNSKWRDGNSKPQNLDPPWTGCNFAKIREGHQDKGSAAGAKISKKADVKKCYTILIFPNTIPILILSGKIIGTLIKLLLKVF